MTLSRYKRDEGATAQDAQTHLFAIGQTVRLKPSLGMPQQKDELFQITATLPALGNSPQYRIRGTEERYERMTTQDNLEAVDTSSQKRGEALIERTFGHG